MDRASQVPAMPRRALHRFAPHRRGQRPPLIHARRWASHAFQADRTARGPGGHLRLPPTCKGSAFVGCDARTDVPSARWLRAQLAFKDSMIRGILQFTPSIAFRYVLHRCESRDIRCRESFHVVLPTRAPAHTAECKLRPIEKSRFPEAAYEARFRSETSLMRGPRTGWDGWASGRIPRLFIPRPMIAASQVSPYRSGARGEIAPHPGNEKEGKAAATCKGGGVREQPREPRSVHREHPPSDEERSGKGHNDTARGPGLAEASTFCRPRDRRLARFSLVEVQGCGRG